MKISKKMIGHILFNLGFWTLFWGAFEFAYQCGVPIWSGTFGYPILHHYILGAIIAYIGYILLCLEDIILAEMKAIRKDLEELKEKILKC